MLWLHCENELTMTSLHQTKKNRKPPSVVHHECGVIFHQFCSKSVCSVTHPLWWGGWCVVEIEVVFLKRVYEEVGCHHHHQPSFTSRSSNRHDSPRCLRSICWVCERCGYEAVTTGDPDHQSLGRWGVSSRREMRGAREGICSVLMGVLLSTLYGPTTFHSTLQAAFTLWFHYGPHPWHFIVEKAFIGQR